MCFFYLKIVIYSLKLSITRNLRLEIELQRLIQQRVNEDVLKKSEFLELKFDCTGRRVGVKTVPPPFLDRWPWSER